MPTHPIGRVGFWLFAFHGRRDRRAPIGSDPGYTGHGAGIVDPTLMAHHVVRAFCV
jgi:hypothetical protein